MGRKLWKKGRRENEGGRDGVKEWNRAYIICKELKVRDWHRRARAKQCVKERIKILSNTLSYTIILQMLVE